MSDLTPILVTGTHRSGTTWVGKMLAADALTAYISEPLNVLHRPGVFHAKVAHWYQYVCDENESEYLSAFQELLEFDYHLWDEIRSLRSRKDFLRMGRDFLIFYNGLMRGQRMLLKDPFAVFSAPWFAKKLNCKIVITVRHPAAFASSLKRLNWPFDFQDLLDQPLTLRHGERQTNHQDGAREQNPDFIIVRHEDLSRDPVTGYHDLYKSLGLEFTPRVEKTILNSSSSENPVELSRKKVHGFKLDSRKNIDIWKKRLTVEEVDRIRKMTEETSTLYYSDAEW